MENLLKQRRKPFCPRRCYIVNLTTLRRAIRRGNTNIGEFYEKATYGLTIKKPVFGCHPSTFGLQSACSQVGVYARLSIVVSPTASNSASCAIIIEKSQEGVIPSTLMSAARPQRCGDSFPPTFSQTARKPEAL